MTLLTPRRATFSRWLLHVRSGLTLLRSLQYEAVARTRLEGRVLDLGGGARAGYLPLFDVQGTLTSVNIDLSMRPTLLADLNVPLPFPTASFDTLLSLNTLEHIQNDALALREGMRVLRPGGSFTIVVPFLYRVHGSPSDYHRHTVYGWTALCRQAGAVDVQVEPLVWDAFSSGFALFEGRRITRWLRYGVMLFAVVRHAVWRAQERVPQPVADRLASFALGYVIRGKRGA